MKKLLFILGIILLGFALKAQTPYYYYYQGAKQYLNLDKSRVFVSVVDTSQFNIAGVTATTKFVKDIPALEQIRADYTKRYWQEFTLQNDLSASQYESKINLLKQSRSNIIVSPFFTNQSGMGMGLSNFLYVKLKSLNDTVVLKQQANNYNAVVVSQDEFMPMWFVVSVTPNSTNNSLELSNIFYESGLFQYAEPDFLTIIFLSCANDTYFGDQWGLNNTGQYGGTSGIDIKACDAWQISTGSNIIVAVLDQGIELDHPDLAANIYPLNFDTEDGTSPSVVRGDHGIACAGIIGAVQNNDAGISGVAPNCKLMDVSCSLASKPLLKKKLVLGINWAWKNGADVISNSWGNSSLQGTYIMDAIDNAVTQGRNGKGCIVVFASGNGDLDSVDYPSNSPNVITVGAISLCGERKSPTSCDGDESWGSNYGAELNIVAPGVLISTTDRQGNAGFNYITNQNWSPAYSDYTDKDYTGKFCCTSAACPHVSGVAALILSVNPNLTGQQVRDIIESTAQKVRQDVYSYSIPSTPFYEYYDRTNGTWNNEMGYGLVDAYAAVQAAQESLAHVDLLVRDDAQDVGIEPNPNPIPWYSPDIQLLDAVTMHPITHMDTYSYPSAYIRVNMKNIGDKDLQGCEVLHLFYQTPGG